MAPANKNNHSYFIHEYYGQTFVFSQGKEMDETIQASVSKHFICHTWNQLYFTPLKSFIPSVSGRCSSAGSLQQSIGNKSEITSENWTYFLLSWYPLVSYLDPVEMTKNKAEMLSKICFAHWINFSAPLTFASLCMSHAVKLRDPGWTLRLQRYVCFVCKCCLSNNGATQGKQQPQLSP